MMSKERELLQRILDTDPKFLGGRFIAEIQELLAQPEPEPKFNFDLERMKAAIESPISDVTVDDLMRQVKQEPLSEDAVDKYLANAIKDVWYPVNEDSYRQGFWDAVKFYEQADAMLKERSRGEKRDE